MKWMSIIGLAVRTVENLYHRDPSHTQVEHNASRQQQAIQIVGDVLSVIEGTAGNQLLQHPVVDTALRQAIDATVALEKAIQAAQAVAAPTTVPAGSGS